ncbi:hypothetical protein EI74_0168 [Mycoplasma testudineum]|uniref:Uncharacterized protein n=1 Tax=Mycoplasma testudineum TaxID=244584 RepID=A0A4R6IH52_9MOLU|nr:hypothetical protein [Mycoplasma testudineum]OYD27101.1 hypothetical protein CG473_00450 [Mycoplasma testudineum]TDO21148.1 hypothetical protein EI74_0168 [Mycoplasma testudineum]
MSIYFKNKQFKNTISISIDSAKKQSKIEKLSGSLNGKIIYSDGEIIAVNLINLSDDFENKFQDSYGIINDSHIEFLQLKGLQSELINAISNKKSYDAVKVIDVENYKDTRMKLVTAQSNVIYKILTNFSEIKKEQKLLIALPGCILPNSNVVGYDDILGFKSDGLIPSEKTLGISQKISPYTDLEKIGDFNKFTWKISNK